MQMSAVKLSVRQLLNVALQVALGMQHLEERKVGKSQKIYLNDNSWSQKPWIKSIYLS